jgi:Fic family protein
MVKAEGLVYKNGIQEWATYAAFLPNQLPPMEIHYTNEVVCALEAATLAIGDLRRTAMGMSAWVVSGISRGFRKKEAQLSSRIEGTIVPTGDLLLFDPETSTTDPQDVREVMNFDQAQLEAIQAIRQGRPLSQHLLKTAHATLLEGARGEEWNPGQYRRLQNMIGTRKDIDTARFVPPPVAHLEPLMDNLIKFINEDTQHSGLIKTGIAHYQIEAIHPFEDGNGRIGRLLIILMLVNLKIIDEALIYPSVFFEANQEEYRDRLLLLSTTGDWCGWLVFFLNGIKHASELAQERCNRFNDLMTESREKLKGPQVSHSLFDVLDLFAETFVLTVNSASSRLGINYQSARNYFKKLEEAEIISRIPGYKKDVPFYLRGVNAIIGD